MMALIHKPLFLLDVLGDPFLPSSAAPAAASPVRLASLPVPLGLRRGAVVFHCGSVRHAGPHRAYLTVNGERVAESQVLQVSWPPVVVTVPTRMRVHATDVSVSVAFTRSLCTTFSSSNDVYSRHRQDALGFAARIELIECSKSILDPQVN